MKNRFEKDSTPIVVYAMNYLPILFFLAMLMFLIMGVSSVGNTTYQKQLESLETALNRSIVQCYAVEGIYPPSLYYMINNYGLTYDDSRFFIDYQAFSSNMYPDVTILQKGGK